MTSQDIADAPARPALKPLSLRRSFSWTLLANGITALSNVLVLSLIAKLGDAAMVGQYTLGATLGAMILALPELSLRPVLATDARDQYRFSDYLGLRLVGLVVGGVAMLVAVMAGGYRTDTSIVVLLVGAYMGVNGVADILYGLLQRREQTNRMAISMIAKALLSVAVVGVAMVLTGRVMVACLALIVSASAVAIWYDFPSARFVLGACRRDEGDGLGSAVRLVPAFDVPRMRSLTRLSLPLALSNSLNLAYYHVVRLVIVRHHGEADLGIYAASAQIALAGHLVTTAFALATGPRMARFYVDRNWEAFTSVLLKFLAVSSVIGASTLLVGVFAGSTILRVLYTADYARQPALFLWLLGAAALSFVATCFGTSLTVSRQFGVQLTLGIVSVATALLVSLWLVPRMGLVGGGIAAAATSVVRLIGLGTVFLVAYSRARNADTPAGMPAEGAMAEAGEDPA